MKKLLLILFVFPLILPSQNNTIDSLRNALKSLKEDTTKAKTLNELSKKLWQTGQLASSKTEAENALKLSLAINYLKGQGDACNNIGIVNDYLGNYPEALNNYKKSLSIREVIGDKEAVAASLNNIAIVYYFEGKYPEAIQNYFGVLKVYEGTGNKTGMAAAYTGISMIYSVQNNFDEALKNAFSSLELRKITGDKTGTADSYQALATIYLKQKKMEDGEKYILLALELYKQTENKYGENSCYNNLGTIYDALGKFEEAKKYFLLNLEMSKVEDEKKGITVALSNLGSMYSRQKKFADALTNYKQALSNAQTIRSKEDLSTIYKGLSEVYAETGKYKESLDCFKLFVSYRDSLTNEEASRKTVQVQMQYDFDKKSAADSIKISEAKKFDVIKHEQEIAKQKTFTYGGVAGFLVMIVVAGISFAAFRNKKKANEEIEKQKALVEEKQKEVLDSIKYASRIQRALITSEKYIERNLNKLKI